MSLRDGFEDVLWVSYRLDIRGSKISVLQRSRRTRHLSDAFTDATPHTDYSYLSERILVEPLGNELSCILKHEVKACWPHVAVHHR